MKVDRLFKQTCEVVRHAYTTTGPMRMFQKHQWMNALNWFEVASRSWAVPNSMAAASYSLTFITANSETSTTVNLHHFKNHLLSILPLLTCYTETITTRPMNNAVKNIAEGGG